MKDTAHLYGSSLKGDERTFMPDVWRYLIDKYGITSVLDIGSGVGLNGLWFHENGIYTEAVDGTPEYIEKTVLPKAQVHLHDYTEGPWVPTRKFDLGWSSEFVEHVEERYRFNFFETFKACKYLCMTHAKPKQGGHHHVNEQTTEYWVAELARQGFVHDPMETARLRETGPDTPYGRSGLCFFTNSRA